MKLDKMFKKKKQQPNQGAIKEEIKKIEKKRRARFTSRGFSRVLKLQERLEKAGIDKDAQQMTRKLVRSGIYVCILLSVLIIIFGITSSASITSMVVFLLGFWIAISWLVIGLTFAAYLAYLDMRIYQRTKEVEAVFPDYLQLASANLSSGMPIDRALWYAIRPNFGVLAKEIETVAKSTIAGEDLNIALENFATKYDSKVIKRSVSLILEGLAAGGQLSDLLSKIALNIEETRILKRDMAANVTTYVIFITFATIVAAPILLALSTQLLEIIGKITTSLGPSMKQGGTMFSFNFSSGSIKVSDFRIFSMVSIMIGSISAASIANIIQKGKVKDALYRIPLFMIIGVVLYFISYAYMSSLFAGII